MTPVFLACRRPQPIGAYHAGDAAICVGPTPAAALAAYVAVFPSASEIWAHLAEPCAMPKWARVVEPKCYQIIGEGIHTPLT